MKRFISLFSGAGGLDLGFMKDGWTPFLFTDYWKPATDTLIKNHPKILTIYDDIRNMKDDFFSQFKDINIVIGGPPCLPEGEKVITEHGEKNIEDIEVGDYVLTDYGRYKKVLSTGFKEYNGAIYGIQVQGSNEMKKFTYNHPINIKRKEKEGFIDAQLIIERDLIGFPIVEYNKEKENSFFYKIKYNREDLLFLIGTYIGDGYLIGPNKNRKRYEICICVGPENGNTFNSISNCLNRMNLSFNIDKNSGNSNVKIRFNNKELFYLLELFGRGAKNKRIPESFLSFSDKNLFSLMLGILITDGSFTINKNTGQKSFQITSISLQLLKQIQKIMLRFGILPSIRKTHNAGEGIILGRKVNINDCFQLRWTCSRKTKYNSDGVKFWIPVRKTHVQIYKGKVYNLEVEDDHTFCCHLIATHNCQPFSRLNNNQLFDEANETEVNMNDPRRSLFMEFLRVVSVVKPKAMLIENVSDLATRKLGGKGEDKNTLIKDVIIEEMEKAGYKANCFLVNSKDYNVPQKRKRIFFLGIRSDLGIAPELPSPVTLKTSVINELSKIQNTDPNQREKNHSDAWIEKANLIPKGGYYNDLPIQYKKLKEVDSVLIREATVEKGYCIEIDDEYYSGQLPKTFKILCHVLSGNYKCYKIMPRMGTYFRRSRDDIAHTITRNPLIHPNKNREMTVREKACVQTFPTNYEFCGSVSEQHILVGNAVPINLAFEFAKYITKVLQLN